MATRQITIDDGSKKRKQVNFDVQTLSLNPAINNGGNYQVAVAPMPLTNQAYQLSENLKKLPAVGAQFAKMEMSAGQERADLIQGQDAEEELNRLKTEEPETFFNFMRRKAYTDSLLEKHVRTQMVPKTLSSLKKSANARLYQNETDFNANIDEQIKTSWQDFEQSVGEDVANSVAGRTIWNNLTDQMRSEAQVAYFESQDKVALENNLESIEHRISSQLSDVDIEGNARDVNLNFLSDLTKTSIKDLMDKHGLSRTEASNHLRVIMATRLKTLQAEGKNLRVLDLAEAMDRTVSDDGVRIYEGDSATALDMAQTLNKARKEIEDLEEEANDLDQVTQSQFTGQLMTATKAFANGTLFEDLTPNQKILVLAPLQNLNPEMTLDMLEAAMKAPEDGSSVGGGLDVFQSLITDLNATGSDRARLLLDATSLSYDRALIVASQIQGPPKVIRNKEKRSELEERYRSEAMMDENLTLAQFLKKENITSWLEMDKISEEMVGVRSLMKSDAYNEVKEKTKLAVKATYATLEAKDELGLISAEARDKLIDDFSGNIEKILKTEAGNGTLESDDYETRRDELVKIAQNSMLEIMRVSSSMDILYEQTDEPDAGIESQEFRHNKKMGPSLTPTPFGTGRGMGLYNHKPFREVKAPFQTNESRLKEERTRRDKNAFFFVPLYEKYMTPWSQEDIDTDRAEMVRRIDLGSNVGGFKDALGYSLFAHGLDMKDDPEQALSLMEKAEMDAMDVSLFTEVGDIVGFAEELTVVFNKVTSVEKLTDEDEKLLNQAKALGLIVSDEVDRKNFGTRLSKFITVQDHLIQRHVK
jgi:hypothetical protein